MKLLLIGPSKYLNEAGSLFKRKKIILPRLNLLLLAGLTPKEVDVNIVEEATEEIDFESKCDLVGITTFTNQAPRAYDIADRFREKGKTVVLGGMHVSVLPDEAKQHADSIIIGEADYLWKKIIEDFNNNELKPIYKCDDLHNLKGLPVPRYDLINRKKYMAIMPVQTSRGCPHNCDFCTVTKFFGGSYRLRPIDDVIRDVKATNSKKIFFVDDNITANRAYSSELFSRLIPLKIRWIGQSTINLGLFPDLCKLATKSGCTSILIGLESINQNSLNMVNKGHNKVQEFHKLLRTIKENGISTIITMIVGLDEDDESIFNDTTKFLLDIKPFLTNINVPIPYPGTKLTKQLEDENRVLHKDWSKYGDKNVVFTPKLLGRDELEIKAKSLYKEMYTIKSIIARSFSQPKKNIFRSLLVNFGLASNVRKGLGLFS